MEGSLEPGAQTRPPAASLPRCLQEASPRPGGNSFLSPPLSNSVVFLAHQGHHLPSGLTIHPTPHPAHRQPSTVSPECSWVSPTPHSCHSCGSDIGDSRILARMLAGKMSPEMVSQSSQGGSPPPQTVHPPGGRGRRQLPPGSPQLGTWVPCPAAGGRPPRGGEAGQTWPLYFHLLVVK